MTISVIHDSCNMRPHRLLRRYGGFGDPVALKQYKSRLRKNNLISKASAFPGLERFMKIIYANFPDEPDIDIWRGYSLAPEAYVITKIAFSEPGQENERDAVRHCYWSGMMVLAMGEEAALKVGNYHETRFDVNYVDRDRNKPFTVRSQKGFFNNAYGVRGVKESNATYFKDVWDMCTEGLARGELWIDDDDRPSTTSAIPAHAPAHHVPVEPLRINKEIDDFDSGRPVFTGDINIDEEITRTA